VHDRATVTGSGPTPTGNVAFTFYHNDDCSGVGVPAGMIALDANGVAHSSADQGPLAAGSYSFQAHYSGDGNYDPANNACEPLTVEQATPTAATTLHDADHNPITSIPLASSIHERASVSGIAAFAPTGSVAFTFYTSGDCSAGAAAAGSLTLDASGVAHPSASQGPLAAGSYSFQAHYGGDTNYA